MPPSTAGNKRGERVALGISAPGVVSSSARSAQDQGLVVLTVGRGGDTTNATTVQLLQDLPADLRERGWQLSEVESRVIPSANGPCYRSIYVRPFDGRLDLQVLHSAAFDPHTRQRIMRISTLKDCSPSWHAARRDAIRRMREADAKRRRRKG